MQGNGTSCSFSKDNFTPKVRKPIFSAASLNDNKFEPSRVVSESSRKV